MSPIQPALDLLGARLGGWVDVASLGVTDREGHLPLGPPGRVSPNGACRLVQAADGWIAVNLAREEDRELVPAWLRCDWGVEPWTAIEARAAARSAEDLLADAILLGLPVSGVGETVSDTLEPPVLALGSPGPRRGRAKAIDLSALWAGPMCGAILAAAGAEVVKVESVRRPDPTRASTPRFFERLNGGKAELALDLASADGQARLAGEIAVADVLITGVRPRGLASLGLSVEAVFAANPRLVWVAVTGHGWTGAGAQRVAFGDDASAAGGLLGWTDAAPRFLGDALADPVTGLAAALGALEALEAGGGVLVDVALARCAAAAAWVCRLREAA